jgi:diguanylate cyclase (GGDEF)-like protein
MDLDGFKPINDTLGHQAGDQVLIECAQRIDSILRESDTVARLGGDEFVVLLPNLHHKEECIVTLKRLLKTIALPMRIHEHSCSVTASIGVSLFPDDETEADALLRQADQAMYIAKLSGKNCYHLFDPAHDQQTRADREAMLGIGQGLDKQEFELYYQPTVNLSTQKVVSAEALIRWNHPELGLLLPSEFMKGDRITELEIKLGEWVIDNALAQLTQWHMEGLNIDVSVNIAACHLQSEGFVEYLERTFASYSSLPAGHFHIEILETAALDNFTAVSLNMDACRLMGVRFALDDFGTGFSSLTHLHRLPVDTLKIDQSFVSDMQVEKYGKAIAQGIIVLAKTFGLKTVAEGLETMEQLDALLAMGCEYGQGYIIARPMLAADFGAKHRKM